MSKEKFEVKSISKQEIPGKHFQGGGDLMNTSIAFIAYSVFGLEPKDTVDIYHIQDKGADAYAFAYMCRRFGFPTSYCDEYKQIGQWYLTTPIEGLYLTVYPYMGLGYGYISTMEVSLHHTIWKEENQPIFEYNARMKKWLKENCSYSLYSTDTFTAFALETKKDREMIHFVKNEELLIAIAEYNQWQTDNSLADLSQDEEMQRFIGDFGKYKNEENKKMIAKYMTIEPKPQPAISETKKKITLALATTAQDLLRYTNVRDVYFNILGWATDPMDAKLKEIYPAIKNADGEEEHPGMYVDYANPNKFTEIYLKGLSNA